MRSLMKINMFVHPDTYFRSSFDINAFILLYKRIFFQLLALIEGVNKCKKKRQTLFRSYTCNLDAYMFLS